MQVEGTNEAAMYMENSDPSFRVSAKSGRVDEAS